MRNNLVLTMHVIDEAIEVKEVIPQRGADEIEDFNVWDMDKPGYHVVKRSIPMEEHNIQFTYQSIWLECYYTDPDGKKLLFKFIASNDQEINSHCITSILDRDNLVLPEFHFSITDFNLDRLFLLRKPIIAIYQIKTVSGRVYTLQLQNE